MLLRSFWKGILCCVRALSVHSYFLFSRPSLLLNIRISFSLAFQALVKCGMGELWFRFYGTWAFFCRGQKLSPKSSSDLPTDRNGFEMYSQHASHGCQWIDHTFILFPFLALHWVFTRSLNSWSLCNSAQVTYKCFYCCFWYVSTDNRVHVWAEVIVQTLKWDSSGASGLKRWLLLDLASAATT